MKYYIYISDAKVNMLLSQIPHEHKKRIATEFKIDLKLLSASRKAEVEVNDDRIAKLEVVCEFIRTYGNIGSVEESDEYIEDTLTMTWVVGGHDNGLVYFSGISGETILGLGGSSKHLIGVSEFDGSRRIESLMSAAPLIISALRTMLGDKTGTLGQLEYLPRNVKDNPMAYVLSASAMMIERPQCPKQRMEFLAKRLAEQELPSGRQFECAARAILATPLYVALAE